MKQITSVFWVTLTIVAILVAFGAALPKQLEAYTAALQAGLIDRFGWYYLIIVTVFVIFCLYLIFSKFGDVRLGKPDEKPEYKTLTWFSMLFSAGMGIGLVFWGVAEPINHYLIGAPTAEEGTAAAIRESMRFTFFHWGIHAWSIYALVALCLAYFKFRKGAPGLVSATLTPIFGDRMKGGLGKAIDVIAVFATIVGVATTLGFGAAQINGGLSFLYDIPSSFTVQFIIIAVVTVLFMISASTGLDKGIKILSNTNMAITALLFLFVLFLGPTQYILNTFTNTIGAYLQYLPQMSFRIAPNSPEAREWINGWTIFYWAWWIAWSPFVGIFIARVSRGRTIREFLVGVLLLPCLVGFLWFSAFGATGINLEQNGVTNLADLATEEMLFGTFAQLPLGTMLSIVGMLLIATFFITSADSATFVLGMQTTNGSLNPSSGVKLTWGIAQSSIAAILLYTGGLQALQNALISAAFPFSIIMVLMMYSLYKALNEEGIERVKKKRVS
ncbi:glycine betaine uptake BCCT transporter [Metabacillus iocasae]|uniref:Glycine betaine transporter n=1 Tax=Priestia iocasae TaxID=2291674 RepID=A0ABS2QXU8_9BACI|nr:BCCT family transporter [Metabacillus iocasae]MBM7704308.1 glycine betaine transporter [Metabacillus iocasae]